MDLTAADIQEILRIFVDSELRELQLQVGGVHLAVSKDERQAAIGPVEPTAHLAPSPPPEKPREEIATGPEEPSPEGPESAEGLFEIRSPLVGVFYRRPAPDKPPYVEVGDIVEPGDPVCTIAIMKMYTEVAAEIRGRVTEICVTDEGFVEHGQVLMLLEPLPA